MKAIVRDRYGQADDLELRHTAQPSIGAGVALVRVHAAVTRLRPGDEVYGTCESGSFAEYAVAREQRLAVKPANLAFVQAAATPISAVTALQSARDADVKAGQRVLITGAGGGIGIGSFAVRLAKAAARA